jgi:hypothetical protein
MTARVMLALLALAGWGCSDEGTACTDGVPVGDQCLPADCPDRDCPAGFVCSDDLCAEIACLDVDCGAGEACADGDCFPDHCESYDCPGLGEVCVGTDCMPASCVGVTCPPEQSCANGRCYPIDCPTRECPGYGEVCVDGTCTQRSCVGVTCPSGQLCAQGWCFPADCDETGCYGDGEVCIDGTCVRRTCVYVECDPGWVCANGWCYPQDCASEDCSAHGEVCFEGACIPADCVGVACPPGERCAHGDCFPEDCGGEACAADEVCVEDRCVNWNCVGLQCPPAHRCEDGECLEVQCPVPCTDANQCQEADCGGFPFTCLFNPVSGQPEWGEFGDTCTDGDPCTLEDTCAGGACTGEAVVCDDPPVDHCDGDTRVYYPPEGTCIGGMCTYPESRQACTDGCVDGACTGDPCADCVASHDCEEAFCSDWVACQIVPAPDGTECGSRYCDGLRLRMETCDNGACSGSALVENCDDGEFCTDDSCSPSGCSNPRKQNGTPCGATYCQGGEYRQEACQGGTCSGSTVVESCDPNESCVEGTGCLCGSSGMNCGGSDVNYCCTNDPAGCYNITNNAFHCGTGCEECAIHMGCEGSQCVCHTDYADCNAGAGCETYIADNPDCGMCGRDCSAWANDRACVDEGGSWRCGCYDDWDCDTEFFICGGDNRCEFFP